jgi:FG-GAP-like repeat/FG-GAP repeat
MSFTPNSPLEFGTRLQDEMEANLRGSSKTEAPTASDQAPSRNMASRHDGAGSPDLTPAQPFDGEALGAGLAPDLTIESTSQPIVTGATTQIVTFAGSGLVFNNTYGSGVTTAYKADILAVENWFQSHFTNSVTANVTFNLASLGPNYGAENNFSPVTGVSLATLRTALATHETTSVGTAAANSLVGLGDPTGGKGFDVPFAMAEILGIPLNGASTSDTVTLNSDLSWTYGQDVIGTLAHELSEGVMGRIGGEGIQNSAWGPMDLFGYSAPGQHDYTGGKDGFQTFFSYNGTNLLLPYHAADATGTFDGEDFADWEYQGTYVVNNDAFGAGGPGVPDALSSVDAQVLEALGWTPSAGTNFWIVDASGNVGTVNSSTGAITLAGNAGVDLTDLASIRGKLYGISAVALYSVNTGTGAATVIGSLGVGGAMSRLAFGPGGALYATSSTTGLLYTVNTSTGKATALSGVLPTSSAGDLAYLGGVFYLADAYGELDKLSIAGSSVTYSVVGTIGYTVTGLGVGADGLLYGDSGTQLITINTTTGAGSIDIEYAQAGSLTPYLLGAGVGMTAQTNPPVAFDFDGNGYSDILWNEVGAGQASIWLMSGTSVAGAALVGSANGAGLRSEAVGDVNGDGDADIIWEDIATGQAVVWEMTGTSIVSGGASAVGSANGVLYQVRGSGDVNGDGNADIVWEDLATGQASVWEMNGTAIVSGGAANVGPSVGAQWQIMAVGDFNGDGKADLVWENVTTGQASIWLMNGTTLSGSAGVGPAVGAQWRVVGVGDFNGDGQTDIAWEDMATGQASIWLMNGTTLSSSATPGPALGPAWVIAGVGDYNGDGKSDLLWDNTATGQASVWLMNGSTILSSGATGSANGSAWQPSGGGLSLGVMGKADIAWEDTATGQAAIWEMNGPTILNAGNVGGANGASEVIVGAGDFNGDGYADLAWDNTATGQAGIWEMQGTSIVSGANVGGANGSNYRVMGVGDFNGDGKADLVWEDTATGQASIWEMNGTSIGGAANVGGANGSNYQVMGAGDFNGDGKADLVWEDTATGQASIWEMNGTSIVGAANVGGANGSNYRVMGVGDVNGDGMADLVWEDTATGQASIWEMNGTSIASAANVGTANGADFRIMGVGDFTGNGFTDIVWENTAAGQAVLWQMAGTNILSATDIGNANGAAYTVAAIGNFKG